MLVTREHLPRKLKQREIINDLDVHMIRDYDSRTDYINRTITIVRACTQSYIKKTGAKGAILGLSGGLDSFVVGAILAGINNIQALKEPFKLTLVALPQGNQQDYADVLESIEAIKRINENVEFFDANIGSSVMAIHNTINNTDSDITLTSTALGNVAARMRMLMQYALASNQIVVGTDHATEAVIGYYTKYGDGGADYMPIGGLLKDDLYAIAEKLGAPECIMKKKPAAGLGITACDEDELGLSYIRDIAPYLRGETIDDDKADNIVKRYDATQHKREMPRSVYGNINKSGVQRITHVVVDCCNDFISGSLACLRAEEAVKNITRHINSNPEENVLYVQETHPSNHCSFVEQGGQWPAHCVRDTEGADIHEDFYYYIFKDSNTPIRDYNIFNKGGNPKVEEYSGFKAFSVTQGYIDVHCQQTVMISGIATEYCIKNTVEDFLRAGYNVIIKEKCLAYVSEEDHKATLQEFIDLGATVIFN